MRKVDPRFGKRWKSGSTMAGFSFTDRREAPQRSEILQDLKYTTQ